MSDTIERVGGSLIQHGPENDRVYVMKTTAQESRQVIRHALERAGEYGYSKIFAKVPESCAPFFEEHQFILEASVPALYGGKETGCFYGRYLDTHRMRELHPETVAEVIERARKKQGHSISEVTLPAGCSCRMMTEGELQPMADLYRQVFPSYPFPIDDPDYLAQTMDSHVVYFGIYDQQELLALASAEIDTDAKNVEMTDFATLPAWRGRGYANCLLAAMEEEVRRRGIHTAYTIARAYSYGMNITFGRQGYHYAGTLVNNTQISGQIESMNVWYKDLGAPAHLN